MLTQSFISYQCQVPVLEVRETEDRGRGVFAQTFIPAETLVCVGNLIEVLPTRTVHSFQADWKRHVQLDEPARLINHGCDFNLIIRDNDLGGYSFYAARDIQPGEELCWHYGMTETRLDVPKHCRCGASVCDGHILGFMDLTEARQRKLYQSGVARYLATWYVGQSRLLEIVRG